MASTNTQSPSEEPQTKTYKQQLDEAAIKAKTLQDDSSQGGMVHTVVEKVSHYVPAVGRALGHGHKEDTPAQAEHQIPGPPERPHHDTQIEEFVRDQHRSKTDDDGKFTE